MSKSPRSPISAPSPVFDNLDYLANPFQIKNFPVSDFLADKPVVGAETDYEYAWKFIYSYNGSSATFNSYRREIERLLQWAWRIKACSILELKREHFEEYIDFCQNPPLEWIGVKNVSRFIDKEGLRIPHPEWRPFVATISKIEHRIGHKPDKRQFSLSQAAVQSIFSILSSFYNFLIQEEITSANPLLLIRQKSKFIKKQQHKAPVRRISNLQWEYVLDTAKKMAEESPEHERTLFIAYCLFGMYLRISELVADERSTPVMGDFRKDMDGNWWFHVTGKGNKSRIVTVSNQMLDALKRYRKHLGLNEFPTITDKTPLVAKFKGKGSITSTRQIRSLMQMLFDKAYQNMKDQGMEQDADELLTATVHWLRHTGISEDVKFRPREHVRDDAGHSSMQTTDRYIESDLRERHKSGSDKKILET
jgi:site-specific recombinase XerD